MKNITTTIYVVSLVLALSSANPASGTEQVQGKTGKSQLGQAIEYIRNERKSDVENKIVDVVTKLDAKDYQGAKALCQSIISSNPANDAAYYYLGKCDYYLRDAAGSKAAMEKAVQLDPHNFWYKYDLANLYSALGEDDMTIDMYETLIKEYPKKTDLCERLTDLYLKQGQYDKALKAMDELELTTGKDEAITMARYNVYMHQSKPEEALKALQDYNKDFSSARILSLLGDYYMSTYDDSLAMSSYEEALSVESDFAPAMLGKSEVYRSTRQYDKYFGVLKEFVSNDDIPTAGQSQYLTALIRAADNRFLTNFRPQMDTLIDITLTHHPLDSTVLETAGIYYYNTDRYDLAKSILKKNADQYPQSMQAAGTYLQLLSAGKEWKAVRDGSAECFKRFPQEVGFLQMQNVANYNLKDYPAMISTCEKIISVTDNDSTKMDCYSTIGDMYHLMGDSKKAYKAYDQVLKISPDYSPALNNYAYYLSLEGKNLKKAYQMSQKTVTEEPDNPTYLDTFGWILYLQGRYLEAKPFFKHAMLYGGKDNATILDHYAEVLYKLKEYDLAKMYWNQAKEKNTTGEIQDLDARVKARLSGIKK